MENDEAPDLMAGTLYVVFFISGLAALIFETVWFRLAGLVFGNSVWSAALILGGFMGGLALGNGLVTRYGSRISSPVRFYSSIEIVIGVTGAGLVFLLPFFETLFVPLFRHLLDKPLLLNSMRLGLAFFLIMIPTTCMGATLPLLTQTLSRRENNFGMVLGRLYGWNTLGAVFGALAGEALLIKWLGLRGAATAAALLNFTAALVAYRISRNFERPAFTGGGLMKETQTVVTLPAGRLLAASFLSGLTMLALEVIWFRFILLFYRGTSLVFSVMLAVVLAGIGLGGLLSARILKKWADSAHLLNALAAFNGLCVLLSYLWFRWFFFGLQENLVALYSPQSLMAFIGLAASLMLPASLVSGVIFTMTGKALREKIEPETRAAGLLTLFNTLGALAGPFVAGFVLLPLAGIELSFFISALAYGLTALVIPLPSGRGVRTASFLLIGSLAVSLAFFPFGYMEKKYFRIVDKKVGPAERIAVRESPLETIMYYRYDLMGKPYYYRLVTNGHSMSGTSLEAQRYMRLFVYLPVALHPEMENALLISYGVGTTAQALTETRNLRSIDIVDISRDIMEMSDLVFAPGKSPVHDPRVSVKIEDGRFFLQETDRRYDLITAEPPPPKLAGIVNLYTEEYFRLMYDRLNEGGMVTYWLPVHSLNDEDAKGIIRAFCNVFGDCSLWNGSGLDWLLLGSRNLKPPASEDTFSRQWYDPVVAPRLKELGFEAPQQFGALFMADADQLKKAVDGTPPLTDNFPLRLSTDYTDKSKYYPLYANLYDVQKARERFLESNYIRAILPGPLLKQSAEYFIYQGMINNMLAPTYKSKTEGAEDLLVVLKNTQLQTLPLWILGTTDWEVEIADSFPDAEMPAKFLFLSLRAVSSRDYANAVRLMEEYFNALPKERTYELEKTYVFFLCMAGQTGKAQEEAGRIASASPGFSDPFWNWISREFGIKLDRW